MTADDRRQPIHSGGLAFIFRPSSLIPFLAGISLGLFLSRFWYELNPALFAPFGDWPATIALAALGAIFLLAQWQLALRHLVPHSAFEIHAPFALLLVYVFWPQVDLRLASILLLTLAGLAFALGLRAYVASSPPPARPPPGGGGGRALHRLAPLTLALIVFTLYVRTLGTHVGKADTFEFQVVAPTLGIAHPTGYPLYVLIGKLFSLLPIGSTAFRVNLTSAVFMTAAAVLVYALVAHLASRRLIAFLAALAFAASKVVWGQAVVAEVYALNALIAGLVVALLVDLISTRGDQSASGDASYVVGALFLLLGLGISHHLTTILLLPACAVAILIARPRLPLRAILVSLGLFLFGLSLWLYIPLRWPALHDGAPMALTEFVDWITGARFGGALVLDAWRDPARWEIVTRFLLDAFGWAGLGVALVGLTWLTRRHWRAALITFVTFAAFVFYGLVYFVPDVSVFLIPAYLIMAIWIGVGMAAPIGALARRVRRVNSPLLALFTLLPVFLLTINFPLVDQRGAGESIEAWGRYVLGLPIPDGAAILVDSEKIAPLYYLQQTENLRPDLDILVLGTEQEYRQQLDARLAQGQPVFLARFLPNLPYPMRSLGPLVEVMNQRVGESTSQRIGESANQPTNQLANQLTTSFRFGDVLELLSASLEPGNPARVTLEWGALTDARPNFHVRLQLTDDQGRVWWEDRGTHPVNGYYPTGAWAEGEVVSDYHEITLDAAIPPGTYRLEVGLFPPFRDEGLTVDTGGMWAQVGSLIAPEVAAPPLDQPVRLVYGDALGVSSVALPGVIARSGVGQVRLNWARLKDVADRKVKLSLVDASGQAIRSDVVEPYGGLLRIEDWPLRSLQATLDFRAPDREGVFTLRLGFVDESGAALPAKCGWLAPPSDDCLLGTVQVSGEPIGAAVNFDNQVLLANWSIDRAEVHPGETVGVQLAWRGLKQWDADYTVTVQLIGPDGRLHGQVDAWPVQGTLPTSAWSPGQTVSDAYRVALQPDAPRGRYRVEVGWYLLATLRRLPVVDAAGRPVDDRFVIGEFDVP